MKFKKYNRINKLKPKKSKFWCKICDIQLVGEYPKCSACKHKNNNKRFKKDNNE